MSDKKISGAVFNKKYVITVSIIGSAVILAIILIGILNASGIFSEENNKVVKKCYSALQEKIPSADSIDYVGEDEKYRVFKANFSWSHYDIKTDSTTPKSASDIHKCHVVGEEVFIDDKLYELQNR